MSSKNRLGKGLESLIPKQLMTSGKTLTQIPLEQIKPNPFQPRIEFDQDAIKILSESIKTHGLTQPIVVRKKGDEYELIAGERRFRACMLAKMETIPAIIKNVSDRESLKIALVENIDRKDLNPIEEAVAFQRLADEFDLTHDEIAKSFSRSRSKVSNTIRLLNLPLEVREAVVSGRLSEGHARTLLTFKTNQEILSNFYKILEGNLNVRETEAAVKAIKEVKQDKKTPAQQLPLFDQLAEQFSEKYKAQIKIKGTAKGGEIKIKFKTQEQFDMICAALA